MNTCQTCQWHEKTSRDTRGGWCICPKVYETGNSPKGEAENSRDHFVYCYNEGGSFWSGNDFGCIHHTPRT